MAYYSLTENTHPMVVTFNTHFQAIDWITQYIHDRTQLETLKEELFYNFVFTNYYFIHLDKGMISHLMRTSFWSSTDN